MRRFIQTKNAPAAIGPYSQAVEGNGRLYVSGQLPIVPGNTTIVEGGIEIQALQSLRNIMAIVEEAGYEKTDIVKCTVFMKNLDEFSTVNRVYSEFFGSHKPARCAIEVSRLPKDAGLEIDAFCEKP